MTVRGKCQVQLRPVTHVHQVPQRFSEMESEARDSRTPRGLGSSM